MNTEENVITVHGKQIEVREDTAKAYRFMHWGVITGMIALAILILAFITLYWWAARSGKIGSPAAVAQTDSK
jgi:uncharacterized BrkB/YihY/UPF0761 family membrane protein